MKYKQYMAIGIDPIKQLNFVLDALESIREKYDIDELGDILDVVEDIKFNVSDLQDELHQLEADYQELKEHYNL